VEKLDRRCLAMEADARDSARMREVVEQTIAEFGRLDTVVINHGIAVPHAVDQEDADAIFDATIESNLSSVWRTARAAIPHMREHGGGSIIVTSSAAGLIAFYGLPGYVASKHGVIGLVKALAAELAPDWIRVNTICPTQVATPMLHNPFILSMFTGGKPDATIEDMKFPATATNLLPIPWVDSEAISHAVLYLASDEAKYVTGIALPVDAGMSVQPPGITPFIGQALAEKG
jgi:(+)-trans-carveol dehydrogenase